MMTALAILAILIAVINKSQGLDTVVLDPIEYCAPLVDYATSSVGPADRLSFDEYKGYVNELISIYPDPFNRGNIYEEIDLARNETSMELRAVFDELANEVCQSVFGDIDPTRCSGDSIQVFEGISNLGGGDISVEVAFMFTVCESSVQFLLGQVRTDSPSMAPSYSGELSFSNNYQLEAVVSAELRDAGKEPTLESAGNSLIQALESYTKVQSWDYIESSGDEVVNCEIQFFDRVIVSSASVDCPVRRSTFSNVAFSESQCFRYSIQTNVRISSDSVCIERRAAIAESLKNRFDNAFRSGELNTFLCTDTECYVLTYTDETERDLALPIALGVTGALFLTIAFFTCRTKSKSADDDDDSHSSAAIQVEFPIPKLPRDDEPIQIEQAIPIAL
mmetsp:Transcript_1273/g.2324  ORF Transcript_1273/g.2324 Transcript_1273/m.2324 type:complete len:392 (-) Transcript_1273:2396-3571(-)